MGHEEVSDRSDRSGGIHRKPTEILKTFMKTNLNEEKKLSPLEKSKLMRVFMFLRDAYAQSELGTSRLATDQTQFYTMATTLLGDVWDLSNDVTKPGLIKKLVAFSKLLAAKSTNDDDMIQYLVLSSKQTTDAKKRKDRQTLFVNIVNRL